MKIAKIGFFKLKMAFLETILDLAWAGLLEPF